MILFYVRLRKRVHIISTISEKSPAGLDSPAEARNYFFVGGQKYD